MRIAVDAHGINRFGGCRTYALPILGTMATEFPKARFDVWLDAHEKHLDGFENISQHLLPIGNRFLARLALQVVMPMLSRRQNTSVTHFMKNLTVMGMRGAGVVTIHDLHPLIDPGVYPISDVLYWRHVQPIALKRADRIIAVSQQTASDLARQYEIDPAKIDVVYHGVDAGFRPRTRQEVGATLARHGVNANYVLHVGAISPKKNLDSLIRAFAILRADGYSGQLVLVGPEYEKLTSVPLMRLADEAGVGGALIVTGPVPDTELKDLMSGAELFVFPSRYEGFGLVVIEAMASGVPVVAARAGAVAEVVGDAAPLIESGSKPEELARHMDILLSNEIRRREVVRACLLRSASFRWDIAARSTMAVYEKAIRASSRSA
jgi:glycosyltransferase involved in cell wall biosynthesis